MFFNKRILAVLLVILLMLCVVGCGASEVENDPQKNWQVEDIPEDKLIEAVSASLNVPDDEDITYEIGEKQYWEDADVYYVNIAFYKDGKKVASADVNPINFAILKNMFIYQN